MCDCRWCRRCAGDEPQAGKGTSFSHLCDFAGHTVNHSATVHCPLSGLVRIVQRAVREGQGRAGFGDCHSRSLRHTRKRVVRGEQHRAADAGGVNHGGQLWVEGWVFVLRRLRQKSEGTDPMRHRILTEGDLGAQLF